MAWGEPDERERRIGTLTDAGLKLYSIDPYCQFDRRDAVPSDAAKVPDMASCHGRRITVRRIVAQAGLRRGMKKVSMRA